MIKVLSFFRLESAKMFDLNEDDNDLNQVGVNNRLRHTANTTTRDTEVNSDMLLVMHSV